MSLTLHVDGGARGNPGPAGAGVVICDAEAQPLFEAGFYLGEQTNNAAEYLGLIHGLQQVQQFNPAELHIYADSELMVKQITGEYRIKNERLRQLYEQVQFLLLKITRWQIRHVRRDANERADQLANQAMDRRQDVILTSNTGVTPGDPPPSANPPEAATPDPAAGPTDAPPATDPPPGEAAAETDAPAGLRQITVKLVADPREPDACPAALQGPRTWSIGGQLPAGLCLYATHALLPTLLAMQNTAPGEFAAIPTMTVRCTHPACSATFQVAPAPQQNGSTPD